MESNVFWLLSQLNTCYSESFSYRLWGSLLQGGEYSLSCRSPASVGVVPSRVRFDLPDGLPGVFCWCRLCLSISFWVLDVGGGVCEMVFAEWPLPVS